VLILISIDSLTGNPFLTVGSGSYFPNSITGTMEIVPYIPSPPDQTRYIPDSAIRLITGTTTIGWDNIYDVRQFIRILPTGVSSGGTNIQGAGSGYGLHPSMITGTLILPENWRAVWAGSMSIENGGSLILSSGTRTITL